KIIIHTFTLIVFTIIWVFSYHQICDYLGIYRLKGSRIVWDYYLTALFYIIQFGIMHLYVYYKELQAQQLIAAQLGKLSLQSELSALKAQLNPHFLYNVFNTINAAIPKSAKPARDMVNELSDLFRYQLKASREERVTVGEELEFVRKYLDLEKERFGERLEYQLNVEEEVLKESIPPLIFQPIVENAIKHGISPLIEGGEIVLSILKEGDCLTVRIRDNGRGIGDQNKDHLLEQGVGLSNTEERLKKMYGNGLELLDNQPRGLMVKFSLPLTQVISQQ
ncbi:MAG: histidine kinase, partial [Bacteroidota bacterium]